MSYDSSHYAPSDTRYASTRTQYKRTIKQIREKHEKSCSLEWKDAQEHCGDCGLHITKTYDLMKTETFTKCNKCYSTWLDNYKSVDLRP